MMGTVMILSGAVWGCEAFDEEDEFIIDQRGFQVSWIVCLLVVILSLEAYLDLT